MGTAERSDDAPLGQRVFGLRRRAVHPLLHGLGGWPQRGILPVGIARQHRVRIEKRRVLILEHIVAVLRSAGPVHQAGRLEGGGIEAGQRQVIGNSAGNGGVLVGCHSSRQRDDDAQAHLLRCVAVGRIQGIGIDERHVQIVQQAGISIIGVQAYGAPVDHRGIVPLAAFQIARNEPADILAAVLVLFVHSGVLGHGFPCARGCGELLQQLAPQQFFVLPVLGHAALAYSHQQLHVMGYFQNCAPPVPSFYVHEKTPRTSPCTVSMVRPFFYLSAASAIAALLRTCRYRL